MSKKYREWNQGQRFLFPPSLEEFVPKGHPAHFISHIVQEELDFREIESDYMEERGAPPYNPRMLTGVLLYGYMKGEYSSRNLSRACEERVDFMVVAGMNKPDHATISRFRTRHSTALEEMFVQIVLLCQKSGLVGLKHVSVDGTRVKSNAAKDKNKTYEKIQEEETRLRKEVQGWLKSAQEADEREDEEHGDDDRGDSFPPAEEMIARLKEAKKELEKRDCEARKERERLEKTGEKPRAATKKRTCPKKTDRYNFTDSDSRLMKAKGGGFIQGYSPQLAVDTKAQVIVSCHVSNRGNDKDELKPTLKKISSIFGIYPTELSADSDFCTEENIKAVEEYQIRSYIPPPRKATILQGTLKAKMKTRIRKGGKRTKYYLRGQTVEPVFGIIKQTRKFTQFLVRGIYAVQAQWSLVCSAHNLWKLFAVA